MSIYRDRIATLQQWLAAHGAAAGLITAPVSMRYLCGWSNPSKRFSGLLLPAAGEPVLVVPALEQAEARRGAVPDLRPWPDGADPYALLAEAMRAAGAGTKPFAVEKEALSLGTFEHIAAGLGVQAGTLLPATPDLTPVIVGMREVKSEAEIAAFQRAADMLNPALDSAVKAIRAGMTERQLVAVLEEAMLNAGAEGFAFDTHVLFGPNAALPHGHPGDRTLAPGQVVLMDFGAVCQGYRSDITRTLCLGEWPEEMARIYEIVLAAHDAAIAAARPGVALGDVDQAARRVIEAAGYGPYFLHRTGHGLGLEIHEEPYVVNGNPKLLRAGHVVTVEPGIYLEGVGGVRIEDDIVVTAAGCRTLTSWSTNRISL